MKIANMKFTKMRLVGGPLVHADGETDGHDNGHSRFSHAKSLKKKVQETLNAVGGV